MSRIPRTKSTVLYAAYTKFEKQHGTHNSLQNTVLEKQRIQYEEELAHDGRNYDVWLNYAHLEEAAWRDLKAEGITLEEKEAATVRVRELYERAVAQVPLFQDKPYWTRYIFLWLEYAIFEEIETKVGCSFLAPFNCAQMIDAFAGLCSGAKCLPDSYGAFSAQEIHVCKALADVCKV